MEHAVLAKIQDAAFWTRVSSSQSEIGLIASAYAQTLQDPLLRENMALYGKEHQRLAAVVGTLVETYGFNCPGQKAASLPTNLEQALIEAGYSDCIDVFLGFGLWELAKQAQLLPHELEQQFETYLAEKSRHLVFFVNWLAFRNVKTRKYAEGFRGVQAVWQRRGALLDWMKVFGEKEDSDALPTRRWLEEWTSEAFLTACLSAHRQFMQPFSTNLLKPQVAPILAALVRESLRVWPKRQAQPTIDSLKL
ncbi:MAG TPA: hypothetical protein V6D19_26055 [Stenomitos sp.]